MPERYAAGTDVTPDRSRAEIERVLERYGADEFQYTVGRARAQIAFLMHDRLVQLLLPLPAKDDPKYLRTPTGRARDRASDAALSAWEQDVRQAWRALSLVIKAKLEAVEAGIVTFEQEWAMHFVLPDGSTVAERVLPGIEQAYATGDVPALLPPTRPALESGR